MNRTRTSSVPSHAGELAVFKSKELGQLNDDLVSRNEVISFVSQEGGLTDLSISRTTFHWGIPVPNNPSHVVYVWLDALTNYLSALGYPQLTDKYPKFWPATHVVGKDILRFHAIYWPAFLLAADIQPPHRIFAHGWWTKDGEKMSKSIGNVLDPVQLAERYGVDYLRYFLASEIVFGNDGDFSDEAFMLRINSDLANDIGNLCQRVLTFIAKNSNSRIPQPEDQSQWTAEDQEIFAAASSARAKLQDHVEKQEIKDMAETIVSLAKLGNKYIDRNAPWSLKKDNQLARMNTVLYLLANLMRGIGIYLQAITPEAAAKILDQLGEPATQRSFDDLTRGILPDQLIGSPTPIFPKIEAPVASSSAETAVKEGAVKEKAGSKKKAAAEVDSAQLAIYASYDVEQLREMIVKAGEDIKAMKAQKAEKAVIEEKVAVLLAMKESFRLKNNGESYEAFIKASLSSSVDAVKAASVK
jgi:methionyl-tRNA synthetase